MAELSLTCGTRFPLILTNPDPASPISEAEPPSPSPWPPVDLNKSSCTQGVGLGEYLAHLAKWAADHDTSTQFHGRVGVRTSEGDNTATYALGRSHKCVLIHSSRSNTRKQIVIRLYPPRGCGCKYLLVVRCGSGWMSARDYFNKEYLLRLQAERRKKTLEEYWCKKKVPPTSSRDPNGSNKQRILALVPTPKAENTVAISPTFHLFLDLPQEVQNMIWMAATGLTGVYRPCRHRTTDYPVPHIHENFYPKSTSPITLATMLRVSKALNAHMAAWIYRSTQFHFELTGFTNFLWISGPRNRANLRRVTFRFSSLAPLHCLRWLAPDPVFELFDPPAYTSPAGLQYFWRCQIQDLARELHLHTLTLDVQGVAPAHLKLVVRVLRRAFGSVEHVRFLEDGREIDGGHWRLLRLRESKTWRDMSREWFEGYQGSPGYMSDERRKKTSLALEEDMDMERRFFDGEDEGEVDLMPPAACLYA